jgi:hypothetical protein
MAASLKNYRPGSLTKKSKEAKDEQKDLENDPEYVKKLWQTYSFKLTSSSSRRHRLEDLLERQSSKDLSISKLERIKKRLSAAKIEQEESLLLVEQIKFLLERLNLVVWE